MTILKMSSPTRCPKASLWALRWSMSSSTTDVGVPCHPSRRAASSSVGSRFRLPSDPAHPSIMFNPPDPERAVTCVENSLREVTTRPAEPAETLTGGAMRAARERDFTGLRIKNLGHAPLFANTSRVKSIKPDLSLQQSP